MPMRGATVVQVLHGLFYVLLQLFVVAAIILSFKFYRKFYCKFYCSCDPSLTSKFGPPYKKVIRPPPLGSSLPTSQRLPDNSVPRHFGFRSQNRHETRQRLGPSTDVS